MSASTDTIAVATPASTGTTTTNRSDSVSPRQNKNSRSDQVKLMEALALDQSAEDAHHGLSKHIFHWPQKLNQKNVEHAQQQAQPRIVVEKRFVKNHHTVHQPGGAANCNHY